MPKASSKPESRTNLIEVYAVDSRQLSATREVTETLWRDRQGNYFLEQEFSNVVNDGGPAQRTREVWLALRQPKKRWRKVTLAGAVRRFVKILSNDARFARLALAAIEGKEVR